MTKIEWTEKTWNPVVGCTVLSPGCTNCYAMKMAARIETMGTAPYYAGTTKMVKGNAVWTGKLAVAPEHVLLEPLRRKKPTAWFVNSMSDLFHEGVPDEVIDKVFAVMALTPQHTYQVLTKRSARMLQYMTTPDRKRIIAGEPVLEISDRMARAAGSHKGRPSLDHFSACFAGHGPSRNIWLGVSAERQKEADERIPDLLATPAAVRFVSAEPLLGPIDFKMAAKDGKGGNAIYSRSQPRLDWVIVGGESGAGARPMHPDWARSIRDQCQAAKVAYFFKQWGAWGSVPDLPIDDDGLRQRRQASGNYNNHGVWRQGAWLSPVTHVHFTDTHMLRVGKKAAGRLLDGREWNEMPTAYAEGNASMSEAVS